MQKIYCFVDESGKETLGNLFVVSVVVLDKDKDQLITWCEKVEKESGKGKFKWGKAEHKLRVKYLQSVFANPRLTGNLRFSVFRKTVGYDIATIMAVAKAVRIRKPKGKFTTVVYVDGLSKSKRHEYARELRSLGISTKKVQGVRKDENNSLTRLADAIAGFVCDSLQGKSTELKNLFRKAAKKEILIEA